MALCCSVFAAGADCVFGSRCAVDLNCRDMVTVSLVDEVDVDEVDRTFTVSHLAGKGGYDISWSVQIWYRIWEQFSTEPSGLCCMYCEVSFVSGADDADGKETRSRRTTEVNTVI